MIYNRYIHIILYHILAFAVLSFASSCSSDAPEDASASPDKEVVFDTEVATRATLVSSSNIINSPFCVYSDLKRVDDNSDNVIVAQYGEEVAFDPSLKKWTYKNTSYWFPDFIHSFVALYPVNPNGITNIKYSNNQLSFIYTHPSDYKNTSDLLVATHRRDYNRAGNGTVCFSFAHILSSLSVRITYFDPEIAEDIPLTINSLTFRDIPTKAKYAVTPASLGDGSFMTYDCTYPEESNEGWTITGRGDVFIRFSKESINIPNDGKEHPVFTSDNALLLLPNEEAPTEMVIEYTVYDAVSGKKLTKTYPISIPQGWSAGRNYILSLTMIRGTVSFSIEVAEWEETTPIGTVVPRK